MSLFIFIGIVIVISFIIRGGYIISKWGEWHGFYDKYGFGTLFFSFFLHLRLYWNKCNLISLYIFCFCPLNIIL